MSIQDFLRIVTRRGWVIVLVTALVAGGALLYAHHQQRIYQATATIFAHPSSVTSPGDYSSDVGMLTYGTLADTFAALAESHRLLSEAAGSVGISADVARHYSVSATTIAQTTVLEISIDGPDPVLAMRLANSLASEAAAATAHYYHIFALSPLDAATVPKTPIRPQTSHDVLYSGLAGVIFGFIIAALSLYLPALLDPVQADRSRGEASQVVWIQPPVREIEAAPRHFSGLADALPARRVPTNGHGSSGGSGMEPMIYPSVPVESPLLKRPRLSSIGGRADQPLDGTPSAERPAPGARQRTP